MRILAVDVGTGTQDILLFDSRYSVENALKLVMPSPTLRIAREVEAATRRGEPLLLTGVTMGGGPSSWAVERHIKAGLPVYATANAARTFNDDLAEVAAMGVQVVSDDEAAVVRAACHIVLRDFDSDMVRTALATFGVDMDVDAVCLAVFDHGDAPPGVSDRRFRFDYLRDRLAEGHGLAGFAFWADAIPDRFTRLKAVAASAPTGRPVLVMDTGPAAVLGALEDPHVRAGAVDGAVVANIGNFHTLAFHLVGPRLVGLFEHHTGELTPARLAAYLSRLADGTITNDEVFYDKGHGAIGGVVDRPASFFAVTGPRRGQLRATGLAAYPAVPHGDMMLAGAYGLLRALAAHDLAHGDEIAAALDGTAAPQSLW